jgi:hypothetical protein
MIALDKPTRIRDPELLAEFRKLRCMACGSLPPNDCHHIKSKGSGGGDDSFNLLTLCRVCHSNVHQFGDFKFYTKYSHLLPYLDRLGWEFVDRKLRRK